MEINRRNFIKASSMAGAGMILPSLSEAQEDLPKGKTPFDSKLNIGFIGTGLRGQGSLGLALRRDDCNVVAICDPDAHMIERTKVIFKKNTINHYPAYLTKEKKITSICSRWRIWMR